MKKSTGMHFYKSYSFRDQDPIVATTYACFKARETDFATVHADSSVSVATMRNWFNGKTKRPRHCTVMAVLHALGYDMAVVENAKFNGKAREPVVIDAGALKPDAVRKRFVSEFRSASA